MSYSDDQLSSARPFVGDETGKIFNTPDLVLQSPTTSERIIDTQSGFLVVIKNLGVRLSLSIRRRIGTPPSSYILLTPDESLRLSQILTEEKSNANHDTTYNVKLPRRIQEPIINNPTEEIDSDSFDFDFISRRNLDRKRTTRLVILVGALVIAVLATTLWLFKSGLVNSQQKQELSTESTVDKFARNYVIYLLDFNPQTYRFSQIQAMSCMSPELLEKYWQETNFPISFAQLKNMQQNRKISITRVVQEKADSEGVRLVEVFADIKSRPEEMAHPVHLQLKIQSLERGETRVLAQKDLG